MGASSKRERRSNRRKVDRNFTGGQQRRAKPKLDSANEGMDEVVKLSKKKFTQHDLADVQPLNTRQEWFMDAYDDGVPMILATGVPGSAKSFLSLYCALDEVFRAGSPCDKVLIVRSAVASREIGHLPGDIAEKQAPFELPYEGICQQLLPAFKDGYKHLKSLGYLDFQLTSHLRGVTWDNTIVIFDEVSSATFHEINTVITRLGQDSRIILAGDIKQCDLTRGNDKSGFNQMLRGAERMPRDSVAHIHYEIEDCVRSGLVRDWLLATY